MSASLANAYPRLDPSEPDSELAVVAPPASLTRFEPRVGEGPAEWARYAEHPSYRDAIASTSAVARLMSLVIFAKNFGLIVCKRIISYELIPADVRTRGGVAFLRAALWIVAEKLAWPMRVSVAGRGRLVTNALTRDGICVAAMDPNQLARISAAAQPSFNLLRTARGLRLTGGRDFMESRISALRSDNKELFAAVETMLSQTGILADVSRYLGRPAKLVDVNPQINDPTDDFWRKIFEDQPSTPRPTAYFHKDASGGDIKAIIYLTDVDPNTGPFTYAIGSHRCDQSTLVDWIEEAIDQSGLSATDAVSRRRFSALPGVLRRKCAFGNDLAPDAEISRCILNAEWVITASRGHVVVFDPKGFHRGGMVLEGERVVLTCVLGSPRRAQRTASGRHRTDRQSVGHDSGALFR